MIPTFTKNKNDFGISDGSEALRIILKYSFITETTPKNHLLADRKLRSSNQIIGLLNCKR
jgi:hypothetical protein